MEKNSKTPELRFEGFTDDWEQRELEDVMDTVTDYVAAGSFADIRNNVSYLDEPAYAQLVRTVDLKKNFTNNDAVYVDENAFKYLWRVNLNEECIVLPNIGANIGEVYYVEPFDLPYDNNVLGPNAILLKAKEDTYFAFTSLNNASFQKQLFENVGASGQPKFNKTELKAIQLLIPPNEEQAKIGQYFKNLDNLITLHQCKLEKLYNMKKSCLQKMFPKDGADVPEIRFSGYGGSWGKCTLGECFAERLETMPDGELLSVTINSGIKKFSDLNRHDNSNSDKSKYKKVCVGDIAYNSMRMWQGASGYSSYEGIVSPAYTVVKPNEGIDSRFFSYFFKKKDMIHIFEINSQGLTSDTWNLKYPAFSKIVVKVPIDIEEQKEIAKFMLAIDNMITYHQQELELTKRVKAGCLQNMFV